MQSSKIEGDDESRDSNGRRERGEVHVLGVWNLSPQTRVAVAAHGFSL